MFRERDLAKLTLRETRKGMGNVYLLTVLSQSDDAKGAPCIATTQWVTNVVMLLS